MPESTSSSQPRVDAAGVGGLRLFVVSVGVQHEQADAAGSPDGVAGGTGVAGKGLRITVIVIVHGEIQSGEAAGEVVIARQHEDLRLPFGTQALQKSPETLMLRGTAAVGSVAQQEDCVVPRRFAADGVQHGVMVA